MEASTGFDDIRSILKEVAEKQREITEQQRENDKEISRIAKIVGDIGNKFGSFTEGMAFRQWTRCCGNSLA